MGPTEDSPLVLRTSPLAPLRKQRGEFDSGFTPPLRRRRGGRGVRF
jgi:hypothetical protein